MSTAFTSGLWICFDERKPWGREQGALARKVTREKLIRTFRWNAKVISWSSALIQAVDSFRYRDDSRIIRLSKQQAGGRAVVSPDNGSAERRRQKEKKKLNRASNVQTAAAAAAAGSTSHDLNPLCRLPAA